MGIEAIGSNQSYQSTTPIDSSSVQKTGADTVTVDAVKPVGQVAEGIVKAENGDQPSDEEIKSAIKEANKQAQDLNKRANAMRNAAKVRTNTRTSGRKR